jgi:hypothetical protein
LIIPRLYHHKRRIKNPNQENSTLFSYTLKKFPLSTIIVIINAQETRLKGIIIMIFYYVLSLFLYFPEDKSEYWSAGFTLLIFMIGALIAMRLFIRISKKEALKAKELEEKLLEQEKKEH